MLVNKWEKLTIFIFFFFLLTSGIGCSSKRTEERNLDIGSNHLEIAANHLMIAKESNDKMGLFDDVGVLIVHLEDTHKHLGRAYRRFEKASSFPRDNLVEASTYLEQGYYYLQQSLEVEDNFGRGRYRALSMWSFAKSRWVLKEGLETLEKRKGKSQ